MELLGEAEYTDSLGLTPEQAQADILDFLREKPGALWPEWNVLNRMCNRGNRKQNRIERKYYLAAMGQLARDGKVIRYRKGLLRGKIRINEAFV